MAGYASSQFPYSRLQARLHRPFCEQAAAASPVSDGPMLAPTPQSVVAANWPQWQAGHLSVIITVMVLFWVQQPESGNSASGVPRVGPSVHCTE